jgi:hypothetical protein
VPPAGEHADEAQPGPHLPDPAAGLAEVLVGQPGELVAAGLTQHALEEVAVARLLLPALVHDLAGAAQLVGEIVAERLELGDVQQPRTAAGGRDADVDGGPRERGDQRVTELALEPLDLRAQGAPGGVVVASPAEAGERRSARVRRRLAGGGALDLPDVIDDDHGQPPPWSA